MSVWLSRSSGPSKQSDARSKPRTSFGVLEHVPRGGRGFVEVLAHADGLGALSGAEDVSVLRHCHCGMGVSPVFVKR